VALRIAHVEVFSVESVEGGSDLPEGGSDGGRGTALSRDAARAAALSFNRDILLSRFKKSVNSNPDSDWFSVRAGRMS
jgi:hypothetical protein